MLPMYNKTTTVYRNLNLGEFSAFFAPIKRRAAALGRPGAGLYGGATLSRPFSLPSVAGECPTP